jgi:hypothetical protein
MRLRPAPAPTDTKVAEAPKVPIVAKGTRVTVTLSEAPLTRLRCNFDDVVTGGHQEVEFDPSQSTGLSRIVLLTDDLANWQVSMWGEPYVLTSQTGLHYIAFTFEAARPAVPAGSTLTFAATLLDKTGGPNQLQRIRVDVTTGGAGVPGRNLRITTAPGSANRSIDSLSNVGNELLTVLAEVAADKAKAAAFQLLESKLRDVVCHKLVWAESLRATFWSAQDGPLLPATCDALMHLRLEELASTAKTIFTALVHDLTVVALPTLTRAITVAAVHETGLRVADASWLLNHIPTFVAVMARTSGPGDPGSFVDAVGALKVAAAGNDTTIISSSLARLASFFASNPSLVCGLNGLAPPTSGDSGCDDLPSKLSSLVTALRDPNGRNDAIQDAILTLEAHVALAVPARTALDAFAKTPSDAALKTAAAAIAQGLDPWVAPIQQLSSDIRNKGLTFDLVVSDLAEIKTVLQLLGFRVPPDLESVALDVIGLQPLVARLGDLLVLTLTGDIPPDRAAQALLAALSKQNWTDQACARALSNSKACHWACGVQLAFAALGTCSDDSTACTPAKLPGLLGPDRPFTLGATCQDLEKSASSRAATLEALVLDGLEVLHPRADATPKSIALATTKLVFDIFEQRACEGSPATASATCKDLRDLANIATNVIDDDPAHVVIAAGSLIERSLQAIADGDNRKTYGKALSLVTGVAGALTAYAATYTADPKGNADVIKQQHEARKQAVEELVTATTQRSERGGDWVASLGVNVGFGVGGQYLPNLPSGDGVQTKWVYPQLELPLGLSVQRLPDTTDNGPWCVGFHLQLSAIDIAQYLAYSSDGGLSRPTWGSFAMIGVETGLLFGTPSNALLIGVDARYAPALFSNGANLATSGAGAFRVGLIASYYVPFIDFN